MSAQLVEGQKAVNRRVLSKLSWLMWALSMALAAAGLYLLLLTLDVPVVAWVPRGMEASYITIFATVGALIASRQPGNWVGWLFLWMGLGNALLFAADGYSIYALSVSPGSLPFGLVIAWINNWLWVPVGLLGGSLPLLLLPNGHLLSPRWRGIVWLTVAVTLVVAFGFAFAPGNFSRGYVSLANPFGLEVLANWLPLLGNLGFGFSLLCITAGVLALILRLHRSRGQERLQLKWIVYASALVALIFPTVVTSNQSLHLVFLVTSLGIPISVGIAILRYNLYDIDLLINRTLVYLPLTAILAGVFAATVVLSQKLAALLGQSSDAATVLTTLIVVAAFTPIRDRLQIIVDKRFKEAPDPAKKLAAFRDLVGSRVFVIDSQQVMRRLLEEAVAAFEATGGVAYLVSDGESKPIATLGKWNNEGQFSVPLQMPGSGVKVGEIRLGARSNGSSYSKRDRAALRETAQTVTQAIQQQELATR
jgi:hypothetical protein